MIITGERHLRLVLGEYTGHYNLHRPHRALQQEPPAGRADPPVEVTRIRVLRRDRLGGLIHEYSQVARGDRIIGTRRFAPDIPCDCHPECTHLKGVAQKRFRKALKTVMTRREVDRIAEIAYDLRSHTGRKGSLFGSEKTFGYSPCLRLFQVADDAVFDYMILGELRNASRRVLAKALGRPG
jgi:hypothetical protein